MRIGGCLGIALAAPTWANVAQGAAGTTCLCRSEDGKSFHETTIRHSRWVCDCRLGDALSASDAPKMDDAASRRRPSNQTCNAEEIAQIKVYLCLLRRCTYPYARAVRQPNKDLEQIQTFNGRRRP